MGEDLRSQGVLLPAWCHLANYVRTVSWLTFCASSAILSVGQGSSLHSPAWHTFKMCFFFFCFHYQHSRTVHCLCSSVSLADFSPFSILFSFSFLSPFWHHSLQCTFNNSKIHAVTLSILRELIWILWSTYFFSCVSVCKSVHGPMAPFQTLFFCTLFSLNALLFISVSSFFLLFSCCSLFVFDQTLCCHYLKQLFFVWSISFHLMCVIVCLYDAKL